MPNLLGSKLKEDAGGNGGQPEVGDKEVSRIFDTYSETYKILG